MGKGDGDKDSGRSSPVELRKDSRDNYACDDSTYRAELKTCTIAKSGNVLGMRWNGRVCDVPLKFPRIGHVIVPQI